MATLVAASGATALAGATVTCTLPAGATTGDLCVLLLSEANATSTARSPAGWTAVDDADVSPLASIYHSLITYRVLQAGDTAPQVTTASKYAWTMIAVRPGAGNVLTFDGSNVAADADGTSLAWGSQAASGTDVSILAEVCRAGSNGTTAVTQTAPTNWTVPTNGSQSTASGNNAATRQTATVVAYRLGQSGTIAPGTGSNNVTTSHTAAHLIFKDAPPAYTQSAALTGAGTLTATQSAVTVSTSAALSGSGTLGARYPTSFDIIQTVHPTPTGNTGTCVVTVAPTTADNLGVLVVTRSTASTTSITSANPTDDAGSTWTFIHAAGGAPVRGYGGGTLRRGPARRGHYDHPDGQRLVQLVGGVLRVHWGRCNTRRDIGRDRLK